MSVIPLIHSRKGGRKFPRRLPPYEPSVRCEEEAPEVPETGKTPNQMDELKKKHLRELDQLCSDETQDQALDDYARRREQLLDKIQARASVDLAMTDTLSEESDEIPLNDKKRIHELEVELEQEREQRLRIEEINEELKEENDQLSQKFKDSEEQIEDLKTALLHSSGNDSSSEEEIKRLNEVLKGKDAEIESLKSELLRTKHELEDLKLELEKSKTESRSMPDETKEALARMQSEIEKIKSYENEIRAIRSENKSLQDKISEIQNSEEISRKQATRIPKSRLPQPTKKRVEEERVRPRLGMKQHEEPETEEEAATAELDRQHPNRPALESHIQFGAEQETRQPQRRQLVSQIRFGDNDAQSVIGRAQMKSQISFQEDESPQQNQDVSSGMSVDEIRETVSNLTKQKQELERKLSTALPREKGVVMARLRAEREQMELELETVTKDISKLKLELRFAQKSGH